MNPKMTLNCEVQNTLKNVSVCLFVLVLSIQWKSVLCWTQWILNGWKMFETFIKIFKEWGWINEFQFWVKNPFNSVCQKIQEPWYQRQTLSLSLIPASQLLVFKLVGSHIVCSERQHYNLGLFISFIVPNVLSIELTSL